MSGNCANERVLTKQCDIRSLASDMGSLLFSGNFSDVTFIVEGHRLPAHRQILAGRSKYFETLLLGNFKEGHDKEIHLHDTPLEAFKEVLNFIYTDKRSFVDKVIL